jgi:competence protein ComEC
VTLLASSVGATVATAPITALAFGTVAPIGVAANLVAIPLASLVVPAVLVSLVAGGGMAAGAGLLLGAVEWVAHTAARVPGGQWSGVAGLRGALPWAAVLAAVVWLAHARPTWARLRWRLLSVGALSGWALLAVDLVRGEPSEGLSLHVLDVGQGDAIAVRTPRGRWLLVDAGPRTPDRDAGREVVAPFLRRRGVARLATLVVSHGDADHLGGAPAVVTAFAPELVLEPGQALPSRLYLDYLADVGAFGTAWRPARAGDTLVLDSVVVRVLHPSASWLEGQLGPNENSVVLHVQYGCFDAVLPGDAGSPVEAALVGRLAPVEVLKVGHHGSASGTTDAWLAALRPAVAVISVGRGNRYGHPAPSVLHRLALRGIAVFRTDRDGTVTIHTDGRYLEVRTGGPVHFAEGVVCRLQRLLRSSGSSLSRNGCTRAPRVSLPICSTTSP